MSYKLFISQPMRDKSNEQIEEERTRAISIATQLIKQKFGEEAEVEVIDSFFKDAPHDAKPLWFLGESFKLLSTADVVFFVNGYDKYRGCLMESKAVKEYLLKKGVIAIHEKNGEIRISGTLK